MEKNSYGILICIIIIPLVFLLNILMAPSVLWVVSLIQALLIGGAIMSFFGFYRHWFKSKEIAAYIGWTSNGFQKEVASVSLGLCIATGIGAFIVNFGFWLATAIIYACFLWGCAINHTKEKTEGNKKAGNAGLILYWDIFYPAVLLGLILVYGYLTPGVF